MLQKFTPWVRAVSALLALCCITAVLTACSEEWAWFWTKNPKKPVNTNDLVMDGTLPADPDGGFEGAVDYDGGVHGGTDIYYVGQSGSPNRDRIIVIDAGHQLKGSSTPEPNGPGSDTMKAEVSWGATGEFTGQTEYELNLKVALLLRDELIDRGYSVVMIRETNNVTVSNMERAEIANKYNAAAYIRIHANSWTDDTMRGAMTICQSASNPYPTCAVHYERSHRLSQLVLTEFCDQTGISKLNMREMDDMTGTNWSRVPTTILEMGFLSNKSDDTLMATDYFRQEAAIGVANGLDAYFAWLETQLPEWETSPQKPAETTPERPTEDVTEEPTEDVTESPTEAVTAEPTDTPAEEPTEEPTEESTEVATAEPAEESAEEPTEESAEEPTEEIPAEP